MRTPASFLLRFLYDSKVRGYFAQAFVLGAVVAVLWFFVANAAENLRRGGIASGFGFLGTVSGIEVPFKLIDYGASGTYARLLLVGVLNTLLISALGIVAATILGFAIGIARLSNNWLLSRISGAFIEFVRNIPLLLFVFFWYFGIIRSLPGPRGSFNLLDTLFLNNRGLYLPSPESWLPFLIVPFALAVGLGAAWIISRWAAARRATTGRGFPALSIGAALVVGLPLAAAVVVCNALSWDYPVLRGLNYRGGTSLIPEFVALFAALSTYTAGFIAEIVRGGILAVSDGQRQAAAALGLRRGQILRLVIIPQAMRVIIPPLTSQYLNLIKNSSFGAVIAFPEIVSVFVGSTLNQTGQAIEVIALTLAIYLAISLAVSAIMNVYNRKTALVTR
ncbi:MAG TPA: ABC transporter permease subunit [Alphaproteobacteria bacterium]|nr:ABC transporter permease subunit [Alphaproteobacteria bacterium]